MYNGSKLMLIIILISILIFSIFIYNFQDYQLDEINKIKTKFIIDKINQDNLIKNKINNELNNLNDNNTEHFRHRIINYEPINSPPLDPIKLYDYRTINDPLKEPKRRVPRDYLGLLDYSNYNKSVLPFIYNRIHTRGMRDNFTMQGYLIDYDAPLNEPNRILQLFGRQKYPKSNQYEYYITFQNGNSDGKYELDDRIYNKELYDNDKVKINLFKGRTYVVKLFKQENMDYVPF